MIALNNLIDGWIEGGKYPALHLLPACQCMINPHTRLHRKTTYSKPNAMIKRNIPTSATGSV